MENISGTTDEFYRYKMPTLMIQNQSNKTVISNIDDISKSLNRSSGQLLKMFGYRRQSNSSLKKGNAFLGGKHNLLDLKNDLQWYIQTYIMCPVCNNPETDIHISKKDKIKLICKACPETSTVRNGDIKLNKWLITNVK